MHNIALVDDNLNFITSLSMALEEDGFQVDLYADGASALGGFERRPPDLAVFDVKMPRMDGIELLERLRQRSDMPVIMLSSKGDEVDEILGLRMGADAYLKKPCSQRVLLARIHALLRRRREARQGPREAEVTAVLRRGPLVIDTMRHEVTWKREKICLTLAEFSLLQALAQQPGVVMSRDQLLDVICEDDMQVNDRTVDGHVKRLRRKLRDADEGFTEIETIYGAGYRYNWSPGRVLKTRAAREGEAAVRAS